MFDTIFSDEILTTDLTLNAISVLVSIFTALFLGILVCATYIISTPRHQRSSSFILSLVVLPSLVAIVIVLIGGNLARAFTTAGIFTLVRFRSVPRDSKDLSYIFLSMAIGLSVGLGYLTLATVIAVIICVVIIIVNRLTSYRVKQKPKRLRITIPEDLNYEGVFDEIFAKYTDYHDLNRVRTSNLGTMFELHYDIILKKGMSEKEFIDELRCKNGNLNIQLSANETVVQQL